MAHQVAFSLLEGGWGGPVRDSSKPNVAPAREEAQRARRIFNKHAAHAGALLTKQTNTRGSLKEASEGFYL